MSECLDDEGAKMIGKKVNEVKKNVIDARRNIKSIDSKMNEIDEKAAFLDLENKRVKFDQGMSYVFEVNCNTHVISNFPLDYPCIPLFSETISRELDKDHNRLNTEGQRLLENAQSAANRLGDSSQQLSEMAKEASTFAAKQEQQQAEIEEYADSAAVNSKNSLNEANEAIFGASTTSQQIETLKNQLEQTMNSFEQFKQSAVEIGAEAKKAHNDAALALSNVEGAKVSQPSVDIM